MPEIVSAIVIGPAAVADPVKSVFVACSISKYTETANWNSLDEIEEKVGISASALLKGHTSVKDRLRDLASARTLLSRDLEHNLKAVFNQSFLGTARISSTRLHSQLAYIDRLPRNRDATICKRSLSSWMEAKPERVCSIAVLSRISSREKTACALDRLVFSEIFPVFVIKDKDRTSTS